MQKLKDFLNQLFQHLGYLEDEIKITTSETDEVVLVEVEVNDENSGILIGKNGEVLNALQRLLRVIFKDQFDKKIRLDVAGYRRRRQQALEELVDRVASEVLQTQEAIVIRKPLSSYERFLVHKAVTQKHPQLESLSLGKGDDRRVTLRLKQDVKS